MFCMKRRNKAHYIVSVIPRNTIAVRNGAKQRSVEQEKKNPLSPGTKFHKLTVVKLIIVDGLPRYECLCDCGRRVVERKTMLVYKAHRSCGCLRDGQRAMRWNTFRNCRRQAVKKNREWSLSFDQWIKLMEQPCSYCGVEKSITRNHNTNITKTWSHNTIDRVDNSSGYNLKNCVTACAICNWMKKDQTRNEFLKQIRKITRYSKFNPPF